MRLSFFGAVALLAIGAHCSSGLAAPLDLVGVPGTYSPGSPVSFDVVLPPINNLGSYNIDLVLSGTEGAAGTDFFFDVAATDAAISQYVFGSIANYLDAVNVDSALAHRLTLSDFDLTGVDVMSGLNDRIATVFVGTSPSYQGELSIAFDVGGLILDTPDVTPTPVADFAQISSDTQAGGAVTLTLVPEPGAVMLLGAGLLMAGAHRSRIRSRKVLR